MDQQALTQDLRDILFRLRGEESAIGPLIKDALAEVNQVVTKHFEGNGKPPTVEPPIATSEDKTGPLYMTMARRGKELRVLRSGSTLARADGWVEIPAGYAPLPPEMMAPTKDWPAFDKSPAPFRERVDAAGVERVIEVADDVLSVASDEEQQSAPAPHEGALDFLNPPPFEHPRPEIVQKPASASVEGEKEEPGNGAPHIFDRIDEEAPSFEKWIELYIPRTFAGKKVRKSAGAADALEGEIKVTNIHVAALEVGYELECQDKELEDFKPTAKGRMCRGDRQKCPVRMALARLVQLDEYPLTIVGNRPGGVARGHTVWGPKMIYKDLTASPDGE